jgi:hypothetical protein
VRLLVPALDFQFTRFSHPAFLHLTAKSQRTQRECFCSPVSFAGFFLPTMLRTSRSRDRDAARRAELSSRRSASPDRREKNSLRSLRLCGNHSKYRATAWAAFLPLAMASTTVLAPLTKSPAAKTPSAFACSVSRSIERASLPDASPIATGS